MIETQNRRRKRVSDLPAPSSKPIAPPLQQNLHEFLHSLGDVLIDITALEVNTMVVEQITGAKFIAWEAYRDIYLISPEYLQQQGIHESLRDRYLELRKTLETEYTVLLSDPNSEFYDPTVLDSVSQGNQLLNNPSLAWHQYQTRLPDPINPTNPEEILKAHKLLRNCRFLRSLRKLSELKVTLDHRHQALHRLQTQQLNGANPEALHKAATTDMICAQTIIQLDGDVINRYAQEIVDHPQRDVILQIHREGVTASEKQWRGLLEFVIHLVHSSLQWGAGKDVLPWGSSNSKGQG